MENFPTRIQSQIICEYIWIDGANNLRSKVRVNNNTSYVESMLPQKYDHPHNALCEILKQEWNFDGSSTGQATGFKSDIILKPVFYCTDPFRKYGLHDISYYLILCDTYTSNGQPHPTNYANECEQISNLTKDKLAWFGFEQEYIIMQQHGNSYLPYGATQEIIDKGFESFISHHNDGFTSGPFYCSIGGDGAFGRKISEEHLEKCLEAGLKIAGTNAEVTIGQWEYQIGPLTTIEAAHQLWMSRFILNKVAEQYNLFISYHPKPYLNWNGSGCHTNFSTIEMRQENGLDHVIIACEKLSKTHQEHLFEYGDSDLNKLRLTGAHETANHETFRYGISDRGASIRIPLNVSIDKRGYLEDRRPGSHCDPYRIVTRMLKTICSE